MAPSKQSHTTVRFPFALWAGDKEAEKEKGRQAKGLLPKIKAKEAPVSPKQRDFLARAESPSEIQACNLRLWWSQQRQWCVCSTQFSSAAQSCPTLCNPMDCSTPGLPVYHQLPELAQTHVHWVGDAIQASHPLSSPSPPAFNLSQHQGLFQWVSSLQQVAKVLEFQPQHQSFQWIFRTDLLAVHGTLKSLVQHHSSKASILQRSAFFTVQLSHPHMTTGKTIALTRWTFVGKVMPLLHSPQHKCAHGRGSRAQGRWFKPSSVSCPS